MSIIMYMIKVSLGILLFYLMFVLIFRRFTFFRFNRYYILISFIFAFLLPVIRIPSAGIGAFPLGELLPVDWQQFAELPVMEASGSVAERGIRPWSLFTFLVLYISAVRFFLVMIRFGKARRLYADGEVHVKRGVRWIIHPDVPSPFTMFKTVYLNRRTYETDACIMRHEEVHARQNHSVDLILAEMICAFLWFNPFVYSFRRRMRENHEFLADDIAQRGSSGLAGYLQALSGELSRKNDPALASNFRSSTIKKRIIMLTNKQTSNHRKWYYLLVIPITALLLMAFQNPLETTVDKSLFTIYGEGNNAVPFAGGPGVPDLFPLDEQYREKVSLPFGWQGENPVTGKTMTHKGVDFMAPAGSSIYAAGAGEVVKSEYDERYGKVIIISHGASYSTLYSHLNSLDVSTGKKVKRGEKIGTVGSTGISTGPHLHFEVRKDGEAIDPSGYY